MSEFDFYSREVLSRDGGRVIVLQSLPENPLLFFPPQAVVYNRSDGRFYGVSGDGWGLVSSGPKGDPGIVVSSSPPSSPKLNELWVQIEE